MLWANKKVIHFCLVRILKNFKIWNYLPLCQKLKLYFPVHFSLVKHLWHSSLFLGCEECLWRSDEEEELINLEKSNKERILIKNYPKNKSASLDSEQKKEENHSMEKIAIEILNATLNEFLANKRSKLQEMNYLCSKINRQLLFQC